MRGLLRMLGVGLLGLGAALIVACGDTNGLLDRGDADSLRSDLDDVAAAVADGNCEEAGSALQRARKDFQALPTDVDPRLRRKLADGLNHLAGQVPEECVAGVAEETTTTETETETTTTETTPTETETTPTTPTETTPTETTPTETTPTETTPTTPTTPGTGGEVAP